MEASGSPLLTRETGPSPELWSCSVAGLRPRIRFPVFQADFLLAGGWEIPGAELSAARPDRALCALLQAERVPGAEGRAEGTRRKGWALLGWAYQGPGIGG